MIKRQMWRFVLAAVVLLIGGAVGTARADTIVVLIDDRGSPIVATVDGVPVSLLPDSHDEFIHFMFDSGNVFGTNQSVSVDLIDPLTATLSDRLFAALTAGSSFIDVRFGSDAQASEVPLGAVVLSPVVETGDFQGLLIATNSAGEIVASVSVASAEVPEPSSLILAGLGGVGFLAHRRRRKRKSA